MKIKRHKPRSVPSLNMASMPDLIFTVLFFFMAVTHMRTETVKVKAEIPEGTELTSLKHKQSTVNLYVGNSGNGTYPVQIADNIVPMSMIASEIHTHRNLLPEEERGNFTVNIKADRSTPMWVITEVKKQLQQVGALRIRYSATQKPRE